MKDEMIIFAESPEDARDIFEEKEIGADQVKVQLIHEPNPQQLLFPFIEDQSA